MHLGSIEITRDGEFRGMVAGDLVVAAGRSVTVRGMVGGDVIAEEGAQVRITGMVRGRVIERGGRCQVSGMVGG